ncbi:uncharacterized protein LOC130932888 [Arachis stenosperma]|uniref:uncharacterized protein LOC130932888 n=1 Tax=Arachis stenosperma TaxID=217475 RepID=UPI0025ACC7C2|nr:uncharacterized protein LOC130932888 [Arachis stenosperma]
MSSSRGDNDEDAIGNGSEMDELGDKVSGNGVGRVFVRASSKGRASSSSSTAASSAAQQQEKKEVFWAPAPLTSKSWADVDDEDDDDYYAITAPPQSVWGAPVAAAAEFEAHAELDVLGNAVLKVGLDGFNGVFEEKELR